MRAILCALLASALYLTTATFSGAEPTTQSLLASDLNTLCKAGSEDFRACNAYIGGFTQGFYYAAASAHAGFAPCIPHGVSDDQARLIVTRFMGVHPEMMQQEAPSVAAEALISAFPCANAH